MSECHYKGYAYSTVDDHSRVILKGKHPEQDTDYINASYIDVSALSPFFSIDFVDSIGAASFDDVMRCY